MIKLKWYISNDGHKDQSTPSNGRYSDAVKLKITSKKHSMPGQAINLQNASKHEKQIFWRIRYFTWMRQKWGGVGWEGDDE